MASPFLIWVQRAVWTHQRENSTERAGRLTAAFKALGLMKPDQSPRGSDLGQRSKMQRLHRAPEEASHVVRFSKGEGTSGRRMRSDSVSCYSSPALPPFLSQLLQPLPRLDSPASPNPAFPTQLPQSSRPAQPRLPKASLAQLFPIIHCSVFS